MHTISYVSPPVPVDLGDVVVRWHGYRQLHPMPMRHRALPGPFVPLIFGFGSVHTLASVTETVEAESFTGGLIETAVSVIAPVYHGLQVDLTPLAAARLAGVPAHELSGRMHGIPSLFGSDGRDLADRLRTIPDWPARFGLMANFLRRRLNEAGATQPDVEHAWMLLKASRGRIGIEELARQVGWSPRRLRARFRSHIGVTPKRAARLWRFQHASQLIAERPDLPLAAVAQASGFFDQAHLTNEIRIMAGLTPTELRGHGPGGVFED